MLAVAATGAHVDTLDGWAGPNELLLTAGRR
jgi:hypothetical protein